MSDNEEPLVIDVPVEWVVPDTVLTSRTTNITIQPSGPSGFIVSFFDQRPPIITGSREEQIEQFKKIEAVPAICTARLFMDYNKLVEYRDVFQATIEEYQQRHRKKRGAQ